MGRITITMYVVLTDYNSNVTFDKYNDSKILMNMKGLNLPAFCETVLQSHRSLMLDVVISYGVMNSTLPIAQVFGAGCSDSYGLVNSTLPIAQVFGVQ